MAMHKNSLSQLLEPLEVGDSRPIWVSDAATGLDIQRRVTSKTRYPKELKGRTFSTKLCVMSTVSNALEQSLWVLVTRDA